jgi:hypothetical protein
MEIEKLARRFRKQQAFAAGYAPLYARLYGIVAEWLEAGTGDPVVDWLLVAGNGRSPFDVPLLLLAGLHRDVLMHVPEAANLAAYYPTVGSSSPHDDPHLPNVLHQTILARRDALHPFIQTATVQTNETARGLVWLLPFMLTNWDAVHLVDLGASAGLNLLAEQRTYRIVDENGRVLADLGSGVPPQFESVFKFDDALVVSHIPFSTRNVQILSRTGCDIAPFQLETAVDEQTLAAYVWADQPTRLLRLREGIAAFRENQMGETAVTLHQATLPDDLPRFLKQIPMEPTAPIILYNTYMTAYLPNRGAGMRPHIAQWAASQSRPVLWLQWEPLWLGPHPPHYGWCAWMADLWQSGNHKSWQLAWIHPHGTEAHFDTTTLLAFIYGDRVER